MPVLPDPIFDDLDATKKAQRLSGIQPDGDVEAQLWLAVIDARNEFYLRLGVTALATLEALPEPNSPPSTDNDYRWLLGYATEQKLIRRTLLRQLTRLIKEGIASRQFQEWNDVAAFREMSQRQAGDELARLDAEIERAFEVLARVTDPGEVPSVRAMVVGSELEDQYRVVGYSLYAQPAYLFAFALDGSNE